MANDLDEKMASQFQGNFLDASDIMALKQAKVTIETVVPPNTEKDSTGKMIDKAILSFVNRPKRLILNKTNAKIIKMSHGQPSEWAGKQITLTVRWLDKAFGQTNVPVIRVVPPDGVSMTFGMRKKYGAAESYSKPRSAGDEGGA